MLHSMKSPDRGRSSHEKGAMTNVRVSGSSNQSVDRKRSFLDRQTLCLSSLRLGKVTCCGETEFVEGIAKYFEVGQSNAIERLVVLKTELKEADTDTFWRRLLEGTTAACHAQCGFVAKRTLVEEHIGLEMPSLENPGSSSLGLGFYYNDGHTIEAMHGDFKYLAWSIPTAFMKHEKVLLVPEKLDSLLVDYSGKLPFPMEAYLAVPLFSGGKCLAHFGLMWTAEGLNKCDISWAYLEMILHSLEDLVLQRILAEENYSGSVRCQQQDEQERKSRNRIHREIPPQAPTASPSLKPYARSLSHELRTPMQGVVGMLDIMHGTVQETIEGHPDLKLLPMCEELRENIKLVQDSARRAVEAVDNVVHAYDLNMRVPDSPKNLPDGEIPRVSFQPCIGDREGRPNILIEGSNIPVNPYKRRRDSAFDQARLPSVTSRCIKRPRRSSLPCSTEVKAAGHSDKLHHMTPPYETGESSADVGPRHPCVSAQQPSSWVCSHGEAFPPLLLHHTRIRDLLRLIIDESLHVGGRPDSVTCEATASGGKIQLRSRTSNGQPLAKTIFWSVDPFVPEVLFLDEKDLAKLISCVLLNALKFTESGDITVTTTLSSKSHFVLINISDTGIGIPGEFIPNLFKPFSREDDSTTRSKEGLGLGLLVAKGLSRKLGGDLQFIRSSTCGPDRGSEFEIRLPACPNGCVSRPATPINGSPPPQLFNSYLSPGLGSFHAFPANQPKATKSIEELSPTGPSSHRTTGLRVNQRSTDRISSATPSHLPITPRGTFLRSGDILNRPLAERYPLTFLVAEDNKINRKILVTMLSRLGYNDVYEAFDGNEAVRLMAEIICGPTPSSQTRSSPSNRSRDTITPRCRSASEAVPREQSPISTRRSWFVDVILMDLWMPGMDGYEATRKIFELVDDHRERLGKIGANVFLPPVPKVLAVSADVTDEALGRATRVGMEGYMTKPYKLSDLERLIVEFCGRRGR